MTGRAGLSAPCVGTFDPWSPAFRVCLGEQRPTPSHRGIQRVDAFIRLPSDFTSADAARAFVAETLESWGVGAYVLETAVLVTLS